MKAIKNLFQTRYFVALFAVLIISARAIWSSFKYDDTSFYLTLLASIVLLIPDIGNIASRITKFKKGDLEIELANQITALAGETKKAEEIEESGSKFEQEYLPEDTKNRIIEYSRDPKGGLIAVAVDIESRVTDLAKRYQISSSPRYLSPIKIIDTLTEKGIIPKVLQGLMRDFWTIRNKAVHDSKFKLGSEDLLRLLDLGVRILDLLYFTNPSIYDPSRTDRIWNIYHAIKRYIAQITAAGTATNESLNKLLQETKDVNVLFKDKEISKYIDLLYGKGVDLQSLEFSLNKDSEKRQEIADKRIELFSWFPRQYDIVDKMFKPYLSE